ncbi:Uncharacterised protein [Raoultella terrigena]|uniref:Uncharacterized protein n=1 Tax=Raoultella terrigena TaxID=577 RepID=A0A4U9CYV6_RAOTE|nr:Uncharacterised protein [Raoultella terrigena]
MRVVPGMMNNVYRRGEIAGYRAEFVIARAAKIVKRKRQTRSAGRRSGWTASDVRLQHGGQIGRMVTAA